MTGSGGAVVYNLIITHTPPYLLERHRASIEVLKALADAFEENKVIPAYGPCQRCVHGVAYAVVFTDG